MSVHQLHRMIGVTYKTAWFMFYRIREAMKEPEFTSMMGGEGGTIEADETYIGGRRRGQKVPADKLPKPNGSPRSARVVRRSRRRPGAKQRDVRRGPPG